MPARSSRFAYVSVVLAAAVAFLVGTIFAGGVTRSLVNAGPGDRDVRHGAVRNSLSSGPLVNFADIVARVNPAVVNIDATKARASSSTPTAASSRTITSSIAPTGSR